MGSARGQTALVGLRQGQALAPELVGWMRPRMKPKPGPDYGAEARALSPPVGPSTASRPDNGVLEVKHRVTSIYSEMC